MGSAAGNAAERLVERSRDVVAAVLLDAAGSMLASAGSDGERSRQLGELAYGLLREADAASSEPVAQVEVAVSGGAVFVVRTARRMFACVTGRPVLPALLFYDLRRTMIDAGDES